MFTALIVVVAFATIAAQLPVARESFIVMGAGILLIGFSGSRWTKFFTERYLSYVASVGVKLFVLYLIMGAGVSIAARWVPVMDQTLPARPRRLAILRAPSGARPSRPAGECRRSCRRLW